MREQILPVLLVELCSLSTEYSAPLYGHVGVVEILRSVCVYTKVLSPQEDVLRVPVCDN